MRMHFVVNPVAGRRSAVTLADAVAAGVAARGVACTRHVTRGPGDAAAHVRALDANATDRLVVVGGDGTLREVVRGRGTETPWPIGLVPTGTANLVARELGMPLDRDAQALALCLLDAAPWTVDLLRITRPGATAELAVGTVGAGLDGEMVAAVSAARAGVHGAGGYARWVRPIATVLSSFRFPRLRVTVDGRRTYAASACIVQNARSYGGLFRLSPAAALDSGVLDVSLIRARTRRDLFRILLGAGLRRAHLARDVKIVRGRSVRMVAERALAMQADGDPAGTTEALVEVLPGALTLLRAAPR